MGYASVYTSHWKCGDLVQAEDSTEMEGKPNMVRCFRLFLSWLPVLQAHVSSFIKPKSNMDFKVIYDIHH